MKKAENISDALFYLYNKRNKRMLKYAEETWRKCNPDIDGFNYWWHRYFTKDFLYFILSEEFLEEYKINYKLGVLK